jgi:hypothetical protein
VSRLVALVVLAGAGGASAEEAIQPPSATDVAGAADGARQAPADMGDQAIGASLGVAGGGRVTTGGLRIVGHYFYQLTDSDWFDGTASFTFGSGEPACFRDRMDTFLCDHSLVDGFSAEIAANVRRYLGTARASDDSAYWPYAKLGVGASIVRFADDKVTGLGLPIHVGAGMRMSVSEDIAIAAEATLDVGIGIFNQRMGLEPQLGGSITAGAEFKL